MKEHSTDAVFSVDDHSHGNNSASQDSSCPDIPHIQGYLVHGQIGQGGMGTVWRAVQLSTRREVALKTLSPERWGSERARRRFDREIELTASLDHSNIARVFDAGRQSRQCYIAMELIEGKPLDQYVKENSVDSSAIIELMIQISHAVQHAHQRGVIHRDIKPSNILVTNSGKPYVLDFGLAKCLDEGEAGLTISQDGFAPGTPAYMSPEQARGDLKEVDTRTDVYALGTILYRLLLNRHPHDVSGTRMEVLRRIAESDVRRPRRRKDFIDPELEAILFKALSHRRDQRYDMAGAFARDLERYQQHLPLEARALTFAYFARQWIRRNKVAITLFSLVFATILTVTIISYAQVQQAEEIAQHRLKRSLLSEGDVLVQTGKWAAAKSRYEEAAGVLADLGESTFEADLALWDVYRHSPPPLVTLELGDGLIKAIQALPNHGQLIVALGGTAYLMDLLAGGVVREFKEQGGDIAAIATSNDGRKLACSYANGKCQIFDVETNQPPVQIGISSDTIKFMAFSDDATRVFTGGSDGLVRTWDSLTGKELSEPIRVERTISGLAYAPNINGLLIASEPYGVDLWDLQSGERLRSFGTRGSPLNHVACSTDGQFVLTTSLHRVRLWRLDSGELIKEFVEHDGLITSIAFSPNNEEFVSTSDDSTIRLWGVDGELRHTYTPATTPRSAAFVFGGSGVVSFTKNQLTIWPNRPMEGGTSIAIDPIRTARFSTNNLHVALVRDDDSPIEILELASGRKVQVLEIESSQVDSVVMLDQRRLVLTGCADGRLRIWDSRSGLLKYVIEVSTAPITCMALSPDRKLIATSGPDGVVELWDMFTWRSVKRWTTGQEVYSLGFSPDGRAIAAGGVKDLLVCQYADGDAPWSLAGHDQPVTAIAWISEGLLLSGSIDRTVRRWDIGTGRSELVGLHDAQVTAIQLIDDGKHIVTGDEHSEVKTWETSNFSLVRSFKHPGAQIHDFSARANSPSFSIAAFGRVSHLDFAIPVKIRRGIDQRIIGVDVNHLPPTATNHILTSIKTSFSERGFQMR